MAVDIPNEAIDDTARAASRFVRCDPPSTYELKSFDTNNEIASIMGSRTRPAWGDQLTNSSWKVKVHLNKSRRQLEYQARAKTYLPLYTRQHDPPAIVTWIEF